MEKIIPRKFIFSRVFNRLSWCHDGHGGLIWFYTHESIPDISKEFDFDPTKLLTVQTTWRNDDARYVFKLALRKSFKLVDSWATALKMFYLLEKRFKGIFNMKELGMIMKKYLKQTFNPYSP